MSLSRETEADPSGEAVLPGTLPEALRAELVAFRRDLHMHPELGNQEFRTTAAIKERLERAGLKPRVLPVGTGLVCDIGTNTESGRWTGGPRMLALRADIDALPIPDTKSECAYRSRVPDRAHACGHDVHTTVVLGTGLVLAALHEQGLLPRPVRLVFQPAEEVLPGGAADAIEGGALDGVRRILAVHCDPGWTPAGSASGSAHHLRLRPAGDLPRRPRRPHRPPAPHHRPRHRRRPGRHRRAPLVARRVDSRSGLALTWGRIESGHAPNVIPQHAELAGTVRCLDLDAWRQAPDLVVGAIDEIANLYRAKSEITYVRGVPPVVNEVTSTELLQAAMVARRGTDSVESTEQSLGGEDFSWYLEHVPGAMARLGVRPPGERVIRDLHQGDFDVDEHAITVGVEMFTAAALIDAVQ
ncbi:M20/M25/M40 family metallo-hydrolase [Streptomyces parvulus]|nr:M20/M25/M40 family metallo-hydrolase [Streptomyces parvulus]